MNRFLLLAAGLICLLPSCRLADPPDLTPSKFEGIPITAGTEPGSSDRVLSRNLVLVSDNQFRYMEGEGVIMTAALVDVFVPTAARPIQLDLFSSDVYRWCLARGGDRPIVHLGDACDISCVVEFTWFAEIMRQHGAPWVMAPGNHDCMFLGSTMEFEGDSDDWVKASKGGGGPMMKDDLVALYLGVLWDQVKDEPAGKSLAAALGSSREDLLRDLPEPEPTGERYPELARRIRKSGPTGSWSSPDQDAFLTDLSWKIDSKAPWRSYIAQRISMTDPAQTTGSGFTGIVLDTCQYWKQPELIPINVVPPYRWNPGLNGELLTDQLFVIKQWMDEAAEQGDGVTLFAHHPVKEFSPKSLSALKYLWQNYDVILLATGHTHVGYIDVHLGIAPTAMEINVASVTDWPMEWRDLQVSRYQRGEGSFFGVASPRYTVLRELIKEGVNLDEAWNDFEEGAKRFLSYRVTQDMALDYSTGIDDLMKGVWLKAATLGTLTWLFLGNEYLAKGLYNNVVPDIQGVELEHLDRRRLAIGEVVRLWDRFPTTGHPDADWRQREAGLRELAKQAMARDSSEETVDKAAWGMYRYDLPRHVADPAKMQIHRVLLAVWASMYEANREAVPDLHDENFRMVVPQPR